MEVYHRPYDPQQPVVCLDETSKELTARPKDAYRENPVSPSVKTTSTLATGSQPLMSLEPLQGRRRVRVTERRTGQDLAEELRVLVEEDHPEADVMVLVTDNLNTHKPACLYERFRPRSPAYRRQDEWHYTPEHGSWLNIAECELSVLARQCLGRRIADKPTLVREVAAWEDGATRLRSPSTGSSRPPTLASSSSDSIRLSKSNYLPNQALALFMGNPTSGGTTTGKKRA